MVLPGNWCVFHGSGWGRRVQRPRSSDVRLGRDQTLETTGRIIANDAVLVGICVQHALRQGRVVLQRRQALKFDSQVIRGLGEAGLNPARYRTPEYRSLKESFAASFFPRPR